MTKVIFIGVLFLSLGFCYGQTETPVFFRVIKDDSVALFFTAYGNLTEKSCVGFYRFSKIDSAGNFQGRFEDVDSSFNTRGKGFYFHGRRNGYFETYYPNGKLNCRGVYQNNKPVGEWEFFYESGLPERTLKCSENEIFLIRFVDASGRILVAEGNGEYEGRITGGSTDANAIIASGRISKGRPDGKWASISQLNKSVYCKEVFENGKFVKGIIPATAVKGKRDYEDKSFIDTFFLNNYLEVCERMYFAPCPQSISKKFSYDSLPFRKELDRSIWNVVRNDYRYQKQDYYAGEFHLSMKFSVNNDGRPDHFEMGSGWGSQFQNTISGTIRNHTKFSPTKEMYFLLKIHFSGGPNYTYSYKFSKQNSVTW
jgi:hypothetical protein